MAYERRSFVGNAAATTLSTSLTSGALSFSVTTGGGSTYPTGGTGNFAVVLDRGLSTEEKVLCSSRSSDTFTVAASGRGYDNTSAQAHAGGATVEHCITKQDIDEANYAVNKTVGQATAVGQLLVVDAANSFAAVQAKTAGNILVGNGTTLQSVAMSGDGTIASGGALTIANSAITSAKIADGTIVTGDLATGAVTSTNILDGTILNADVNASAAIALSKLATIADQTILGNNAGSTGVPLALTAAQARTVLGVSTSGGSSSLGSTISTGSTQSGINTITDVTGMSVAVTVPASATIMVIGHLPMQNVGAAGNPSLLIRETSTTLQRAYATANSGDLGNLTAIWVGTPSTGAHTYKLSVTTSSGTVTTTQSATQPASIVVLNIT